MPRIVRTVKHVTPCGSGHIRQRERVQERPFESATTMRDEVSLQKSWLHVIPFGEGADRDLLLEQPAWLGGREPVRVAQRPQQTVRRGRAERQQLLTDVRGERQVTVALECWDELGKKRDQTLSANPIGGRPRGSRIRLRRLSPTSGGTGCC